MRGASEVSRNKRAVFMGSIGVPPVRETARGASERRSHRRDADAPRRAYVCVSLRQHTSEVPGLRRAGAVRYPEGVQGWSRGRRRPQAAAARGGRAPARPRPEGAAEFHDDSGTRSGCGPPGGGLPGVSLAGANDTRGYSPAPLRGVAQRSSQRATLNGRARMGGACPSRERQLADKLATARAVGSDLRCRIAHGDLGSCFVNSLNNSRASGPGGAAVSSRGRSPRKASKATLRPGGATVRRAQGCRNVKRTCRTRQQARIRPKARTRPEAGVRSHWRFE